MPYFIVDGMRDGSRDPLYIEAMNADEALSKASKRGMHTTGIRPATTKYSESLDAKIPLGILGVQFSGIIALLVASFVGDGGMFFSPVMFAYLALGMLAQSAANSQASIKQLQEEIGTLREIVESQKRAEAGEPRPVI